MSLLHAIRSGETYRGQIRAILTVGQGESVGPIMGSADSCPNEIGPLGSQFVKWAGCNALSSGQSAAIAAIMEGSSSVVLSGPGRSGLTFAGLVAATSKTADRFEDALCVAPSRKILQRWRNEYETGLNGIKTDTGFFTPIFCDDLSNADHDRRPIAGRLVLTSMEAWLDRLARSPDLDWLAHYDFLFLDSIEDLLAGADFVATTVIAHAIAAVRETKPGFQVCVSCARFEGNARFAADLLAVSQVDVFECDSREGEKTLVLWSAPLDRERFGGEIKPGDFFDDLVGLCSMLSSMGLPILLYDGSTMFCRSERDELAQRVADQCEAPYIRFCATLHEWVDPDGFQDEALGRDDARAVPVRICLGLQVPLGVLRDRLRSVSSTDALILLVEARTPCASLHRHAMSRRQAGLSAGLPPECRFFDNALQIGFQKALDCIDDQEAFRLRKRYLDAHGVDTLTQRQMDWARNAWERLKTGCLEFSQQTVAMENWTPLNVSVNAAVAREEAGLQLMPGMIPTDFYPGALVTHGDRRYQVIRPGKDLRQPWVDAELQATTDVERETSRIYTVVLNGEGMDEPLNLQLDRVLFPGVRYDVRPAQIEETVTGFETVGRFSSDLHRIGGAIAPVTFPARRSDVLLIRPMPEILNASGMASLCALLPDAVAMRMVMRRHALACVMLDAEGRMCADDAQAPAILAVYARDPMDHATIDSLSTAGVLQDVLRMALAILLACPCSDGCPSCLYAVRLPPAWRERKEKDGLTRSLGRLLGYNEAEMVADDRRQMRKIERIADRLRDLLVPHQLCLQLDMDFPTPVTLRHLVGKIAEQNPHAAGLFTGDAVYVRPNFSEAAYIGLLSHEYMHQWQHVYLKSDLQAANPDNIEDPENILFPAYGKNNWSCRGHLYIEGSAEWTAFRVADVFNLKSTMTGLSSARGNEYGEGFQHVLWLERKYGIHRMLDMLRNDRPDASVYCDFESQANRKVALYEASLLYAALSDSALPIIESGGLACCNTRGDWPYYTRVSHFRSSYRMFTRDDNTEKLPDLEEKDVRRPEEKSEPKKKTADQLAAELLDVSVGVCLDANQSAKDILADLGLNCADCACNRGDNSCTLRSVAYMHSNADRSAQALGEELAHKIAELLLSGHD